MSKACSFLRAPLKWSHSFPGLCVYNSKVILHALICCLTLLLPLPWNMKSMHLLCLDNTLSTSGKREVILPTSLTGCVNLRDWILPRAAMEWRLICTKAPSNFLCLSDVMYSDGFHENPCLKLPHKWPRVIHHFFTCLSPQCFHAQSLFPSFIV